MVKRSKNSIEELFKCVNLLEGTDIGNVRLYVSHNMTNC